MTLKGELEELFLRKKPVRLLLCIKMGGENQKYVSVLSKETDCTYSHTVKLLNILEKLSIVEFKKEGRIKFVKLTAEGEELANDFEAIQRRFTKYKQAKKK
mgnify:CR=1 FL=1